MGVHDVGPIAVDKQSHLWMPGAPVGAVDLAVRIDAESKCHCRAPFQGENLNGWPLSLAVAQG